MLVVYVWIDVSTESCFGGAVDPEVAVTIIVLPAIGGWNVGFDCAEHWRQGRAQCDWGCGV